MYTYFKITKKQWNKFSYERQVALLQSSSRQGVHIIFTNTPGMLDKFTLKNLNRALDKTTKGIDDFSKMINSPMFKQPKKDYSFITGR